MDLFLGIVLGLAVLVLLVIVHELGHAIVARRSGVVVQEFGVGFPPRAWARKLKKGVLLSINWLPLGGFVKLQGEYDSADKPGDYGNAGFWQKTKILLAGVAVNWLVAVLILTGLALVGLPKILPNQFSVPNDSMIINQPVEIVSVTTGHAADKAGLKVGDQITNFAGQSNLTPERIIELSKQNKGQTVAIIYKHDGQQFEKSIKLGTGNDGIFGVSMGQGELVKSTWSAPIVGVGTTVQFTYLTVNGVGQLVGNLASGLVMQLSPSQSARNTASQQIKSVSNSVAGPVGILGTIFPAARNAGLGEVLFLTAIISLTLAVMNILPIPSLDGGRWMTMAVFKLTKKKLTKDREEKIQTVGFIILMFLVLLVTAADIIKIF